MADVKVFVDDAVTGRLPDVCARDGVIAHGRLVCTTSVGGSTFAGVLWILLLLAGPIGWIVAAVLASRGGEELSVELPYSDEAYERMRAHRRLRNVGLLVLCLGFAGMFVLDAQFPLSDLGWAFAALVPIGGLATYVVARFRLWQERIGITLDGSRRWVTLSNVHPSFARACDDVQRRRLTPTT